MASSWRNKSYPLVVEYLRNVAERDVYDFRQEGFAWADIDPNWQSWDLAAYKAAFNSEKAAQGFFRDKDAMVESNACVLVLPCGASAHLEAGWFIGRGKPTCIFLPDGKVEPELMYRMADLITDKFSDLQTWVRKVDQT